MKTENYLGMFLILATIVVTVWSCHDEAYPQEVAPTPSSVEPYTQVELAAWWAWMVVHPQVISRVSNKYELPAGGILRYEERCKVPGPPWKTPFGSMRRYRVYKHFINLAGNVVPQNQGWNYEALEETGIGEGSWDKTPFPLEGE